MMFAAFAATVAPALSCEPKRLTPTGQPAKFHEFSVDAADNMVNMFILLNCCLNPEVLRGFKQDQELQEFHTQYCLYYLPLSKYMTSGDAYIAPVTFEYPMNLVFKPNRRIPAVSPAPSDAFASLAPKECGQASANLYWHEIGNFQLNLGDANQSKQD